MNEHRERIFDVVREYQSDAYVEVDPARELLVIEMPDTTTADSAAEALRLRLLTVGVTATRVGAGERASGSSEYHYAQPQTPPIQMNRVKPRRTVPLVAFIAALLGVALAASIFSFTLGALFAAPLGKTDTLGTSQESVEDYVGKISLVDQLYPLCHP